LGSKLTIAHSLKLRYVGIGIFNTFFGFGVYTILMGLTPDSYYILALTTATCISGLESYLTQRKFVWKSKANTRIEFVKFWTVLSIQFTLNSILLFVCVEFFEMEPLKTQYVIGSILILCTFFFHRQWTFRSQA
jgi:putative flippase GtrA